MPLARTGRAQGADRAGSERPLVRGGRGGLGNAAGGCDGLRSGAQHLLGSGTRIAKMAQHDLRGIGVDLTGLEFCENGAGGGAGLFGGLGHCVEPLGYGAERPPRTDTYIMHQLGAKKRTIFD